MLYILINKQKRRRADAVANVKKPRLTREDLDSRITAQQEKNRARRETKVTPADIQARLDERRARRAERAVPGRLARNVSLGLGIALLVGSGIVAVTTTASTQSFALETEVNEQRIASAKGDLDAIPAADDTAATEYAAELASQIAQATAKGEEVAALQQEFATILFRGNTQESVNGAPSSAFLDSVEHRRLLAPYFVERSLIADESDAYAPGSVLPFDDDEIDPRFPWHVGYQPGSNSLAVADPGAAHWTLASVMATATPGVLDATWRDNNSTGELLAWATASYYVDPGAFGSLTVGQTTLGERGAPSIDKAGE
jgi:hypothetical protein